MSSSTLIAITLVSVLVPIVLGTLFTLYLIRSGTWLILYPGQLIIARYSDPNDHSYQIEGEVKVSMPWKLILKAEGQFAEDLDYNTRWISHLRIVEDPEELECLGTPWSSTYNITIPEPVYMAGKRLLRSHGKNPDQPIYGQILTIASWSFRKCSDVCRSGTSHCRSMKNPTAFV